MAPRELGTYAKNTWCPGCGNFAILNAFKAVLKSVEAERGSLDDVVMVSGIGCNCKISDYVNINSFYSLHGRVVPAASGIRMANPGLTVVGFAGDGDCYGEGLEHLLFAAKRNVGIKMFVHNNRVYGLTTGQYTPTSPLGFKGRSTPHGTREMPINPIELMLASGASFVARAYSGKLDHLKAVMKQAMAHKGLAFVDILQVCATFFNKYDYYNERVYEIAGHDDGDLDAAMKLAKEWDYNSDAKIPLGIFYRKEAPVFEDGLPRMAAAAGAGDARIRQTLAKFV
jgi:2-oxoglutarate ferredoxin oxidoreductase subunit beta